MWLLWISPESVDYINHDLLWYKLLKAGVSSMIIRVLRDLYGKANMKMKLNADETNHIEITQGVLQGDSGSLILFSIFTHDIHFFITNGHDKIIKKMEILLFADDLILISNNILNLQKNLIF